MINTVKINTPETKVNEVKSRENTRTETPLLWGENLARTFSVTFRRSRVRRGNRAVFRSEPCLLLTHTRMCPPSSSLSRRQSKPALRWWRNRVSYGREVKWFETRPRGQNTDTGSCRLGPKFFFLLPGPSNKQKLFVLFICVLCSGFILIWSFTRCVWNKMLLCRWLEKVNITFFVCFFF